MNITERNDYIAITRPLLNIVWQASPSLCLGVFVLTIATGIVPLITVQLNATLLDVITRAILQSETMPYLFFLPRPLTIMLILLAGVGLLSFVLGRLSTMLQHLYQRRVTNYVQLLIAEKAASLDLAFFENPEFHNQLMLASQEAAHRPAALITQLATIMATMTTLVSMMILIVFWQPWIIPVVLLIALLRFRVASHFGTMYVNVVTDRAVTQRKAQYYNALLIADTTAKDLRLFGLRDFFLGRLSELLTLIYHQDSKLARSQALSASIVEVVATLVRPGLIGFTALQAIQRTISIGQFSLYTQAIIQIESGLGVLMSTLAQFHEHFLFITNLFRFLKLEPIVEASQPANENQRAPISATPTIEYQNVSFHYAGSGKPVLKDVSFSIQPGEVIAVVGENGAGKTTLVKLLTGLYRPTEGHILFDTININTLNRSDLRSFIGVIFQDYPIYHFSIYENVGIGNINQMHEAACIEAATRRSGLDQLIKRLPQGYGTVLGRFLERGHELSGGQRQLVALARSLMRNAPILVLDEPSAALDIQTEQLFFQRLLEEQRDMKQTVIFISHRFSTVRRADRILVLKDGRIAEEGSHDQLMAKCGYYAEMFAKQVEAYNTPVIPPAITATWR